MDYINSNNEIVMRVSDARLQTLGTLDVYDCIYLAGIMDAKGKIHMRERVVNEYYDIYVTMTIYGIEDGLCDEIKKIVDGCTSRSKHSTDRDIPKKILYIKRPNILTFSRQIMPYSRSPYLKKILELVIDLRETYPKEADSYTVKLGVPLEVVKKRKDIIQEYLRLRNLHKIK